MHIFVRNMSMMSVPAVPVAGVRPDARAQVGDLDGKLC